MKDHHGEKAPWYTILMRDHPSFKTCFHQFQQNMYSVIINEPLTKAHISVITFNTSSIVVWKEGFQCLHFIYFYPLQMCHSFNILFFTATKVTIITTACNISVPTSSCPMVQSNVRSILAEAYSFQSVSLSILSRWYNVASSVRVGFSSSAVRNT